jgi:hypothetical protein
MSIINSDPFDPWNLPISKGGPTMYATKIVNEQGKPCMFVAKLK